MVALQTTEAVVPGSNPASLTVENSEDRQSHCVYCKISGREGDLPLRPKKRFKKKIYIYWPYLALMHVRPFFSYTYFHRWAPLF